MAHTNTHRETHFTHAALSGEVGLQREIREHHAHWDPLSTPKASGAGGIGANHLASGAVHAFYSTRASAACDFCTRGHEPALLRT